MHGGLGQAAGGVAWMLRVLLGSHLGGFLTFDYRAIEGMNLTQCTRGPLRKRLTLISITVIGSWGEVVEYCNSGTSHPHLGVKRKRLV